MRWPAKPETPEPEFTGKRTARRFAVFPTKVDLDEDPPCIVWLEWYWCYQEWDTSAYDPCWRTLARYSAQPELGRIR
jgi:hypothetical protein